jgi:hypothetical protein
MTVVPMPEDGAAEQKATPRSLDTPSPAVRSSVVVVEGRARNQPLRLWVEVPSKVERGSKLNFHDSTGKQLVLGEPRISYVSERLRGHIFFHPREDSAYLVLTALDPIVDDEGLDHERFAGKIEKVEYISPESMSGEADIAPRSDFIPNVLPYRNEATPPAGYELRERRHWGQVVLGMSAFTAAYGAAFGVALDNNFQGKTEYLLIPVAGPWVLWGHWAAHEEGGEYSGFRAMIFTAAAVVDSGLQITGLLLAAFGMQKHPWRYESASVSITPVLNPSQTGVLATGRF